MRKPILVHSPYSQIWLLQVLVESRTYRIDKFKNYNHEYATWMYNQVLYQKARKSENFRLDKCQRNHLGLHPYCMAHV
jgi:hypothetical protein